MKKADRCEICNSKGSVDCLKCPEYDTCDNCGRRVCYYVAVTVDEDELWCRPCCRQHGFSKSEIKTQNVKL